MERKSDNQNKRIIIFGMLAIVALNIADIIYHQSYRLSFADLHLYWEEYRVTLLGYDTGFYYHNAQQIPGAGWLPAIPIFPWGRILGNLICPGFLKFEVAKWWTFWLLILLCVITSNEGFKRIYHQTEDKAKVLSMLGLAYLMPFYWRDMLIYFNVGGVICFLLIWMVFLLDNHPYLAGILLAISMMKPQNALPFVIILMLEKRWKTLVSAAGFDVGAWITCAVMTRVNPINQVLYTLGRSTEEEPYYFWFGLMDPMRHFGISSNLAMLVSMILGVGILLGLYKVMKNADLRANPVVVYAGAAVISTVWMYKSKSDFVVIVLASMLALDYFLIGEKTNKNTVKCLVILALLNILVFTEPIRILTGYSFTTGMTLDAWGRTLAIIALVINYARTKTRLNNDSNVVRSDNPEN